MDHQGTGEIDFNKMKMWLNLHSYKHFPGELFPIIDRLNDTRMDYYSTMSGDFETLTFTGKVSSFFVHGSDTLFHTTAYYKLVDDFITVNANNATSDDFRLYAQASKLWDDPTFDILEVKNVPIDSLSGNAAVRWLSRNFRTDFFLSGPLNFPSAKLNMVNRQSEDVVFALSGNVVNLLEPNLKFNGRFRLLFQPMEVSGRFLLKETANRVNLQLIAPDVAEGRLSIGLQNDSSFIGNFQLKKTALNRYLGRFPGLQQAISEGFIWGEAQFSGTTNQPKIDFNFRGDRFIINENGYYSALLRGVYRKTGLTLKEARIDHNERPIFNAHFNLNMQNNQCEGRFQGERIESNFLASTIFNDSKLIRGDSRYDISIRGLFERPEIWGLVIMHDGVLFDQAFRNLTINFRDSIPATATLFQIDKHIFNILNFIYVDKKGYTVEAKGTFAVDPGAANDLRINVKGNILSEVPLIIEYFRNPNCVGELSMHVTGTRENPRLNAGRLIIYNGSLEFESVIPKLTDIRADVELKEGERFVRIHTLEGKLENRWVRIGNLPASAIKTVKLQPWNFRDIGLNFGVLTLETDPKGIPLSIPGLMNPGDIGYFATDGMQPGEKFYFAGPIDLPHVRGKGTIYESRVTFPFLITEETDTLEESVVMDFLMNIDWDVQVVAGLSNRYFVDIPAVIGEVYMDLSIDEVSQGLHFTGRLIDESFRVEGEVESTRGRVEYLDVNFRVEKFGAIFNRFELYPEVYGRAWTTVRDSTNFPKDIYLVLYAVDPETKQEVSRGRWEDFRFKLVSSDPTIGETQENVLSYLGYSIDNLSKKAGNVGLTLTENYLIRPLVRPLERTLERSLKLDYVRLQSSITSNLFYYGFQNRFKFLENPNYYRNPLNNNFDPALLLLQSSEVTLGKYLLRDIYLTYSGQLVSVYDESKLGLNHKFGLEYRLLRNTLLEFEYDKFQFNPEYYSRRALQDWRIRLRHSFNF
ncbi:hypothetical protein B1H10_04280 [candidate division KSB1 bacterium 4484_188]|nr:MAG: hypothetical protein B1H10_04280 [candidate division KSB1 bacterium 4484_188]